jgi:hypothetical protein
MTRRLAILTFTVLLGWGAPASGDDQEPDYPHGEYVEDCEKCHSSEGWSGDKIGRDFNHAAVGFPLTGTHALATCRECHATLEFSLAEGNCVSCHLDVHHGELGGDCSRCHTTRSFIDRSGMVRAHLTTRFQLRGVHRVTDCNECHRPVAQGSLQYVNTPVECEACHLDAYLATTLPNHQASGFPTTCDRCHEPHGWTPARFDHGIVATGTACASCHLDDYQATTDPAHQAAGFPQSCETCHATSRWVPAAFDGLDHDARFFPIYSGAHRGKWSRCSDCHVVPSNFAQFNCLNCHDNPGELANEHSEVSGYAYDSRACYNCHPRGRH